ncbi:hypothetical protein CMI47_03420 [Candidatus Pacearchaeota archaeon]|nr:hypothetical protein [Candidatus Pacearchaeota archaeon]|tara:strand:- start:2302 stop:2532 length:231 start_codon:yes stop_codon:yes gene_type:complete
MVVKKAVAATKSPLRTLWALAVWITGVLVSLAVGFGMIDGVLTVRYVTSTITLAAGWVVVVLTVVGVVLAIIDKVK